MAGIKTARKVDLRCFLRKGMANSLKINVPKTIEEHEGARKALAYFYKYQNDFSTKNVIRSNLRWLKQRALFLKDYYQKDNKKKEEQHKAFLLQNRL